MAYTDNGLTIEVYVVGSSARALLEDPGGDVSRAYGLQFGSTFPGGLYADCSFYVPRDLASYWNVRGAKQVVIRNGIKPVYEGKIDILSNQIDGADTGTLVQCTGYWGALAMRYAIRKRWADKRITEDVWKVVNGTSGEPKCTIDRQSRIRFTPKAVAWATNNVVAVRYKMPTGQTAKRIKYTYAFAEAAQAWRIDVRRSTDGVTFTQMTNASGETYTTGTTTVIDDDGGEPLGNVDVTLATPSQYLDLRFYSEADQTPAADGTIYGEFSAITVYGETGTIDAEEITYDVMGLCSEMSSSQGGSWLSLETLPAIDFFIFHDFTTLADILTAAASYGNTSDESIYFQMIASELGEANDGKPVLSNGVYPDLSSADYVIRFGDSNVVSGQIERDYSRITNWLAVKYTDERGEQQTITPDDAGYTALTDATSVAAYGRRVSNLTSGTYMSQEFVSQLPTIIGRKGQPFTARPSTAALALYHGKRHLKRWKDPKWKGSITVTGYVLGAGGNRIPASEIEAGKVLDLANYVVDEVLADDTLDNPRVIITATSYDNDSETCTIAFGPLDDLVQPEAYFLPRYPAAIIESGGATSGGKAGKLNWKRKKGIEEGSAMWDEAVKLGKKAWEAKYPNWKKPKG